MDNIEYIEAYYSGPPSEARKKEFEDRILNDPSFAEELAFYLSAKSIASEYAVSEKRERFRKVYSQFNQPKSKPTVPVKRMVAWVAAAAAIVFALIVGWVVWLKPIPAEHMADNYIHSNFTTLSVTMGTQQDSLQMGLKYYNEGNLPLALTHFENILKSDPNSPSAKKYAGIVSLRLGIYDKAVNYFSELETDTMLQVNPGKFLHALALIKRAGPGDKEAAKGLLQQLAASNQFGTTEARQWLKNW